VSGAQANLMKVFARLFQKAAQVEGAKPSSLVATSETFLPPFFLVLFLAVT